MATFITLVNFTDQGIKGVKESPDRLVAFRTLAEKLGVSVKSSYYTVGHYDIVVTVEGSDEAVTAALLKVRLSRQHPDRDAARLHRRRVQEDRRQRAVTRVERSGNQAVLIGSACSATSPDRPGISPATTRQRGSAAVCSDSAIVRSGTSR